MIRLGYAAKPSTGAVSDAAAPERVTPRAGSQDELPCSFAQEQFWFVDQLSPGTLAYNFSWPIRLRGPLNALALDRAFSEVVRRHEALRTRFVSRDGHPVQVVEPERTFALSS